MFLRIKKNHFDPFVAKMTTVEGKPKLIIDLSINCIHQMMHTELIPKFCAFIGRFIAKMTTVERGANIYNRFFL